MVPDDLLAYLEHAATHAPTDPADAYSGTLTGLAVGNALGGPVEGFTRRQVGARFPDGICDIAPEESGGPWDDDVAQAIELAGSLVAGPLEPELFLERLIRWAEGNGRGMGRQTRRVLRRASAGPIRASAARSVWEEAGRRTASNGAVMRCPPLALRWHRCPARLITDARRSARITHYDPRSVWSTVAVCAAAGERDDLRPDRPGAMGDAVRTMGIGLWAAVHGDEFADTLLQVIRAGGDTDTNGAVAGALLGARFGRTAIPERWRGALPAPAELERLANRLHGAAAAGTPAEDRPATEPPILYLDVDGVLLRDVPPPGSGPEARSRPLAPADGAADFLSWAMERYEVRWLTAWAPGGRLAAEDRRRLAAHLGVDERTLARIRGRPWHTRKIDGIDVDEPRDWWWVDDSPDPEDLETLARLGEYDRWVECRSDRDAGALAAVRARLER